MSRITFAAALIGAGILLGQSPVCAQGPKPPAPDPVNITTVDGVKLKGQFYPAPTKCLATVIMLHPIGDGKHMNAPEWKALAEKLQAAEFSVMTFDFRGHGESTAVEAKFWGKEFPWGNVNRNNVKLANPKMNTAIDVKEYIKHGKTYLPILINDIAAVRAFLDRRNDNEKDCNTKTIIVIGVDSSATLGAIWINSEWHRYKYTPNEKFNPQLELQQSANYSDVAGDDIKGAVFLTINPSLEGRTISLEKTLKIACKDKAMAAGFFVGKKDQKAMDFTKMLIPKLKIKGSDNHIYIDPVELDTNLTGIKLLQKGLKTDTYIVGTLNAYIKDKKAEREMREFPNTNYRWKLPNGATAPARETLPFPNGIPNPSNLKRGEKNLLFDDYSRFIPQ